MKEIIRYGVTLALICIIASASLASVNALTKSKIIEQSKAEEQLSLNNIFPEAARFEPVRSGENVLYYKAIDTNNASLGIVFKVSGKGYSSTIETVVGMASDGTIKAIKVIGQNETPGLGAHVADENFTRQFKNRSPAQLDQVQAISGATISSRAVIEAVKKKAEEFRKVLP